MSGFAEIYDSEGCGASPKLMFEHDKMLKDLTHDMKEVLKEVKKFNTITILNGDDGTTPTTFDREDYFQMIYNRTSAKHKLDVMSSFSTKVLPILALLSILISAYLSFTAVKTEKELEHKTKTEQSQNK